MALTFCTTSIILNENNTIVPVINKNARDEKTILLLAEICRGTFKNGHSLDVEL